MESNDCTDMYVIFRIDAAGQVAILDRQDSFYQSRMDMLSSGKRVVFGRKTLENPLDAQLLVGFFFGDAAEGAAAIVVDRNRGEIQVHRMRGCWGLKILAAVDPRVPQCHMMNEIGKEQRDHLPVCF